MINEDKALKIAQLVADKGGRAYYVGGLVRDRLMGKPCSDIDIEVHGIEPKDLFELLKGVGDPLSFGSSFGIYSLKGTNIDIAMPRKEHATGRGHRDFDVFVDPYLSLKDAATRRDFTMNAVMEDILTGELIDPFGGKEDIEKGIIRHVNDLSFAEDPLRVLRAAQFKARFGFSVADRTKRLCKLIDLSFLTKERVEGEMKKALLSSSRPSVFFEFLKDIDQLDFWFKELGDCIGVEQDPIYHPEGDVFVHTMEVIDRAAAVRGRTSDPYAFMLLALTHDFGKTVTTERINGRIHAYGHETEGVPLAESFIKRISNEKAVLDYVVNMVPLHMKPNLVAYSKSSIKSTNRMFDSAIAPKDLIYIAMADKPVMSGTDPFTGDSAFLFERYEIYLDTMRRPYVSGKDLVEAGLTPSADFSDILAYAHKLRLARVDKEHALKQVLAYAGKMHK